MSVHANTHTLKVEVTVYDHKVCNNLAELTRFIYPKLRYFTTLQCCLWLQDLGQVLLWRLILHLKLRLVVQNHKRNCSKLACMFWCITKCTLEFDNDICGHITIDTENQKQIWIKKFIVVLFCSHNKMYVQFNTLSW